MEYCLSFQNVQPPIGNGMRPGYCCLGWVQRNRDSIHCLTIFSIAANVSPALSHAHLFYFSFSNVLALV